MVRSYFVELVVLAALAVRARTADVRGLPPCDFSGTASRDVTVENGSTFTMTCISREAGAQGATIRIVGPGQRTVPQDQLRRLNSSHVTWKKPNVRREDSAIYLCAAESDRCTLSTFNVTSLVVAYSPQEPVGHSCVGRNLEQFTCRWNMPDLNTVTHYRVSLRVGTKDLYSILPCNSTEVRGATDVTCTLSTAGDAIYRIEESAFLFTLTANNTFGNKSWDYEVDHYRNVLLAAPSSVACSSPKSRVEISWSHDLPPVHAFPRLEYQVRLVPLNHPQRPLVTEVLDGKRTVIGNLIPNTKYVVSVRTKFVDAGDDLWSSYGGEVLCSTAKDRPTAAPSVATNGFSMQDSAQSRDVRVYFRGLPRRLWNGDEMRYLLEWRSDDGRRGEIVAAASQSHFQLRHLSHEQEYTLSLYAENEVGRSNSFARLVVPKTGELLPPVANPYVDETAPRHPRLFHSRAHAGVTYTLFWRCRVEDDRKPGVAKSENVRVSWKVSTSSDDSPRVSSNEGPCDYAVASTTETGISPMLWVECVVPTSREYQELVDGTDRIHVAEATQSSIRLEFLTKCGGLVHGRNVAYHLDASPDATDRRPGNPQIMVLDAQKAVAIPGLSSGNNYVIHVSSTLRDGTSVAHRRLTVKTASRRPVTVIIGVALGCVLLVVLGYVIFHYCRRLVVNVVKYRATTVEVLVPAHLCEEDALRRSESWRSSPSANDARRRVTSSRASSATPSLQTTLSTTGPGSIPPALYEALERGPDSSAEPHSPDLEIAPSSCRTALQISPEKTANPAPKNSNAYTKVSQLLFLFPERADPLDYTDPLGAKTRPSDDRPSTSFDRTSSSPGNETAPSARTRDGSSTVQLAYSGLTFSGFEQPFHPELAEKISPGGGRSTDSEPPHLTGPDLTTDTVQSLLNQSQDGPYGRPPQDQLATRLPIDAQFSTPPLPDNTHRGQDLRYHHAADNGTETPQLNHHHDSYATTDGLVDPEASPLRCRKIAPASLKKLAVPSVRHPSTVFEKGVSGRPSRRPQEEVKGQRVEGTQEESPSVRFKEDHYLRVEATPFLAATDISPLCNEDLPVLFFVTRPSAPRYNDGKVGYSRPTAPWTTLYSPWNSTEDTRTVSCDVRLFQKSSSNRVRDKCYSQTYEGRNDDCRDQTVDEGEDILHEAKCGWTTTPYTPSTATTLFNGCGTPLP